MKILNKTVYLMLFLVMMAMLVLLPMQKVEIVNEAKENTVVKINSLIDFDDNDPTVKQSEEKADYIKENLAMVVEKYNETITEESELATATFVENEVSVYLTFEEKYATYLDFNDNNGYLIIDGENNLHEFQTKGDLEYLKDVELTYYNTLDKFLYYDEDNGCLQPCIADCYDDSIRCADEELCNGSDFEEECCMTVDGQVENSEDGKIYDINAYVAEKYSQYSLQSIQIIPEYDWKYQFDTSLYTHKIGNKSYTEGNCALNAAYSMMFDWKRKSQFSNLDTNYVNISSSIYNDSLYPKYGTNTYDGWFLDDTFSIYRRKLYLDVREEGIARGYLPDVGMKSSEIPGLVETVAAKYGHSIDMRQSSAHNAIVGSINNHRAGVLSVQNSPCYHNHAMGLYGFEVFHYQSGWWIFKQDHYAYFYLIDDGHSYKYHNPLFAKVYGLIQGMDGVAYNVCYYDANYGSVGKTFTYVYSF
ncbi:MAG: hypothetical protein WCR54_06025 [Clostridia bacterium]